MEWLKEILPDAGRVVTDGIEERYLSDTLGRLRGRAAALVFAESTEEVSGILREAHRRGVPVTPRGAGTNLVGSTVPADGGIVLDFTRMNRILGAGPRHDDGHGRAGNPARGFTALCGERGPFLPARPRRKGLHNRRQHQHERGGMRAVKYGVTRDYVRGLEVVLADGTVMTVGGKNVKDASGLSLKNLFIGSEGTLCVITKCILRLIPKPAFSKSALVPYPDLESGIRSVLTVLQADVNPTAVEFIQRDVVKLGEDFSGVRYPRPDAGSYILLTFDGRRTEVESALEDIRALTLRTGALEFIPLDDPCYAADIWKVRGALVKAVEAASEQEPVDIVVPISRTAEFIRFVRRTEAESGLRMVSFGHAGDGNVHLCVVRGDRSEEAWRTDLRAAMEKVYAKACELGGVPSGEHGIGLSKRHYFLRETAKENIAAMNRIKDALDPKHILNDQKSYIIEGCEKNA